jgi:hypothetical protein
LCNFRLEPSSLQLQNLPMLHPLVWLLLPCFSSKTNTRTGIYP